MERKDLATYSKGIYYINIYERDGEKMMEGEIYSGSFRTSYSERLFDAMIKDGYNLED